jgi:hypothetical protein
MQTKMICKQCGIAKPETRFFYHSRYKRYSYICKLCEIKNAAINRNRAEIRASKNIEVIKKEVGSEKYMTNGIEYLADILTNKILRQRHNGAK